LNDEPIEERKIFKTGKIRGRTARVTLAGTAVCALVQLGCQNDSNEYSLNHNQVHSILDGNHDADANTLQTTTAKTTATKTTATGKQSANRVTAKKPVLPPSRVLIDRTKPIVGENGTTYTPGQLHKNSSLLVLAFEPDIRADYVIMTTRELLDDEQSARAKTLALTYEDQFKELIRKRSSILEGAADYKDVDGEILKVQMKLADLLRQIRSRINIEILTQEQRDEAMRIHQAYLKAQAEKAASK